MPATLYDNMLRYHVDSGSRAQVKHLVDLDLYDGNGACSCEHFTFKLEPYLKKGVRDRRLRCRHINEARELLADEVIRRIKQNGGPHAKPKEQEPEPEVAFQPAKKQRTIPPPRKKAGQRKGRTLK